MPQKLNMFNFFQMIPGSSRLAATVADSYRFVFPYKFSKCRRSTQTVADSRRHSYDCMETRLNDYSNPGRQREVLPRKATALVKHRETMEVEEAIKGNIFL